MQKRHRVVIIGGGFAGLYAALNLKGNDIEVTLIDKKNYHLFQPLLYQVATGGLSPADIATPLRYVLRRRKNVNVIMGEVTCINPRIKKVTLRDGEIRFDSLVVCAGSSHHYFGNEQWAGIAPGLKTLEDATDMRSRILRAFEAAEREDDPEKIRALLSFVIIGAGPTGVELAGTLAEIARHTLKKDFRKINTASAQIFLLEGNQRIMPMYPEKLSAKARQALEKLGVTVRTGTYVTDVRKDRVEIRAGDKSEYLAVRTVLWAAGVKANRLGELLAQTIGVETDRAGRIKVQPDLSIPGYENIYVIGDLSLVLDKSGKPLPGLAPVAMQQGRYVARLIGKKLRGKKAGYFRYRNRGSMATIGRRAAVADLGWIKFSGVFAWLLWLFIHLLYIVEFQNRLLVLMQWSWNYITRNRSARIITGKQSDPQMLAHPLEKILNSIGDENTADSPKG